MTTSTTTPRRLAVGSAAVLLAAAVGLPSMAQAATPAALPTVQLAAAGQAASAINASTRLSPAVTHQSSTLWKWADGTPVKAGSKDLSSAKVTSVPRLDHGYRISFNERWTLSDVLADGRAIGLDGSKAMISGGSQGRRLFSNSVKFEQLWAVGNTVYGLTASDVLYRSTTVGRTVGVGKKAIKVATLRGAVDTQHPVVSGGRVYWTQQTGHGDARSARVVSVPLKGGTTRVEAKNARNPQAIDGGVLVSTVKPAGVVAGILPITGFGRLTGHGGVKSVLRFTKGALTPADGLDYSIVAAGRTLSISNGGKAGMLVVDLRSRKAWNLKAPKGTTGYGQSVTGSTVSYTPFRAGAYLNWVPTLKRVFTMDSASGKLSALGTWAPTANVVSNGRYVAWQDADHDGYPFIVSYRR